MNIIARILKNERESKIIGTGVDGTPCLTSVNTLHDLEFFGVTTIEEPYRRGVGAVSDNFLLSLSSDTSVVPIGRHSVFL